MHSCNFLRAVYDGDLDPELTSFIDEAWFHLSGCVSPQTIAIGAVFIRDILRSTPSRLKDWCVVCHYCCVNSRTHIFLKQH
jgi:hypothetical protein